MPITPYPQPSPTISGANLTLSVFLNNPPIVHKRITDFAQQRFLLDRIFTQGPTATGGAVVFDQVTSLFFYLDRDVQDIRPGSEFPILNGGEQLPNVALVRKIGGEVKFTYEAVRRDNRALVDNETRRLANNIVRFVDGAAIAALNAAPINTYSIGTTWSTGGSIPFADIAKASKMIYGPDLGYQPDTLVMNPTDHVNLITNSSMQGLLPREDTTPRSPVFGGRLNLLEGLDIFLTNRTPAGTLYLMQSKTAGMYSEEIPQYTNVIQEQREEAWYIHAARVVVPYVTEPLAVVKMTGA